MRISTLSNGRSWRARIGFVLAGVAVFAGGLSIGNLVSATETEPIIMEPAQLPQVHNDFCDVAPVTCAPFMQPEDAIPVVAVTSPASLSA